MRPSPDLSNDNEPFLFTDLEISCLSGAFVAIATEDWHQITLARVAFKADLVRHELGRSGYREAELAAFTLGHDIQMPTPRLVTRDELRREWVVLPVYCRTASLYFWELAKAKTPQTRSLWRRWADWLAQSVAPLSDQFVDPLPASHHRETIQREVVYALGSRIRSMRFQLEQLDDIQGPFVSMHQQGQVADEERAAST